MQTTHSAQLPRHPRDAERGVAPARESSARAEIDRLREAIADAVRAERVAGAREAIDTALDTVARLQVVTENLEACNPPSARAYGAALVALADRRLHGAPDAIERGITYTSDNQLRLLEGAPTGDAR